MVLHIFSPFSLFLSIFCWCSKIWFFSSQIDRWFSLLSWLFEIINVQVFPRTFNITIYIVWLFLYNATLVFYFLVQGLLFLIWVRFTADSTNCLWATAFRSYDLRMYCVIVAFSSDLSSFFVLKKSSALQLLCGISHFKKLSSGLEWGSRNILLHNATLREKCSNIFLYFDWKYRPEKTPYLDTFHVV